jgi:hypothetical protein
MTTIPCGPPAAVPTASMSGVPEVAAAEAWSRGRTGNRSAQAGDRGLAVGAGDADDGSSDVLAGQLDLAGDGNSGQTGCDDRWTRLRHARRTDDELHGTRCHCAVHRAQVPVDPSTAAVSEPSADPAPLPRDRHRRPPGRHARCRSERQTGRSCPARRRRHDETPDGVGIA